MSKLKKHVGAVHVNNRFTLLQRKAFNVLLHNAYEQLRSSRTHSMLLKDFLAEMGFNSNDYALIKSAVESLMTTIIDWNLLDDGEDVWSKSVVVSDAKIDDGVLTYSFSETLSQRLYDPNMYSLIDLNVQKGFDSGYALALYENLMRFKRVGTTGFRKIELWRQLFGIPSDQYTKFKELNRTVIMKAVQSINANPQAEIYVLDPVQLIEKRRIVELKFDFVSRRDMLNSSVTTLSIQDCNVQNTLQMHGVSRNKIEELFAKFSLEHIETAIIAANAYIKSKPRNNIAGVYVSAIEEGWVKSNKKINNITPELSKELPLQKKINASTDIQDIENVDLYLSGFLVSIEGNTFLQNKYSKDGLQSTTVLKAFKQYIASQANKV